LRDIGRQVSGKLAFPIKSFGGKKVKKEKKKTKTALAALASEHLLQPSH